MSLYNNATVEMEFYRQKFTLCKEDIKFEDFVFREEMKKYWS